MVNARRPGLLAYLLVVMLPGPALAWGDLGHRIICEIAFQELEPTARERVKALIRRDREFDTFAEACSWPDHPRRRAPEHYVNLPRGADGLEDDSERDRAGAGLSPWVGDIHQPLHVSFEDDRGGNEIGVSGGLCS